MAKVVEDKLGRPVQLMMKIAGSEVKAASVDPAPGKVILLVNPRTCEATLAASWTRRGTLPKRMPRQRLKPQQQLKHQSLCKLKFDQVAI